MARTHTVRAVNPAPAPKGAGRAGITPWQKTKTGRNLTDHDSGVRLTVSRVPGTSKKRWYVKLSYVGDRAKEEGKGVKGYLGNRGAIVRDRDRALAWTSEKEAMTASEQALEGALRAANPQHARRIRIDRDPYCVEPYTKTDGTEVEGYCVPGTSYTMPDPGKPGRRSRGAKAGPFSASKGYKPWIQREGKLGGPGYTERPQKQRREILAACVNEYGYRSCLGSVMVLMRNSEIAKKTRKVLESDKKWLMDTYGGAGSFGPESNPKTLEEIHEVVGDHLNRQAGYLRNEVEDAYIDWEESDPNLDPDELLELSQAYDDALQNLRDFEDAWENYDWAYLVTNGHLPKRLYDQLPPEAKGEPAEGTRGKGKRKRKKRKANMSDEITYFGIIGDRNPIEHWGGVVYDSGYGPTVKYFQSYDDERVSIYDVSIDDDVVKENDWVDWKGVASYTGQSTSDLRKYGKSKDPLARASVVEAAASYHGWDEFDSYPEDMTIEEAEEKYGPFVDAAHGRSGNPGHATSKEVRKIKNRVLR